jgi:hypothetical protein
VVGAAATVAASPPLVLNRCLEGLRASYGALYRPVTGKPAVMKVHGPDSAAQLRRV